MTRERLEKFNYITTALKLIDEDMKKLEANLKKCSGKEITDSVKGSMVGFPYIEVRYPVVGMDNSAAEKIISQLAEKRDLLQKELGELEDWLGEIDDVLMYNIFRMRYRNRLSFEDIGKELGYSRGRISQLHKEYLQTSKD